MFLHRNPKGQAGYNLSYFMEQDNKRVKLPNKIKNL